MGKPLTIQIEDEKRIEELKKKTGLKTKIDVVRAGLGLLEHESERQLRIERWKKAAHLSTRESTKVNAELRKHSRLKKVES